MPIHKTRYQHLLWAACLGVAACSGEDTATESGEIDDSNEAQPSDVLAPSAKALENRAYIVSRDSEELTVIDLDKLEIIGRVPTGGGENHMAELNGDFTKAYITASADDKAIVVDTRSLRVTGSIDITGHPTHLTLTPDASKIAVMVEATSEVSFLDMADDTESMRLSGFETPHFMRFTPDNSFGYVANISGNFISRVDMRKMEVVGQISLDQYEDRRHVDDEGGFADAQIAPDGTLFAAHHLTGKVLTIDAMSGEKKSELAVGKGPWVAFAEHPFQGMPLRHVVTNFGDKSYSVIDADGGEKPAVTATLDGDEEAYGVNFSPLEPDLAFVMNRVREDIAVVDTAKGEIVERIDVGGNTEIASTTADGKHIVAAVSNRNRVVVIDVLSRKIVKTFDNVGNYPWSVTIPKGQNYCH
jgi:DNA-binding beta-propeller fold protein YncE